MVAEEWIDMLKKALQHYANRLQKLQKDSKEKLGSDLLGNDLELEISKAEDILNMLKSSNYDPIIRDNKDLICHALGLYKGDLEASKQMINEIPGLSPKLQNVEEQLRMVSDAISKFKCG